MNSHRLRRWLFISTLIVVAIIALSLMSGTTSAKNDNVFTLQAPAFIHSAYAQANPTAFELGAYLDQEAGISAYYKSPNAITLSQVRSTFRTIETETADYIIGSVAVTNYAEENFDVHVYVHKTGWILAYYLKVDPVSKIIDVRGQTINTTKLKTVISVVAGAAGVPFTDVTYYDFRYPNATNLLFVAENLSNGNDFTIQLPSAYGYSERSWALIDFGYGTQFLVDGIGPAVTWSGNSMWYGTITSSQLLPDVPHTVTVDDYGVLVLVYQVP